MSRILVNCIKGSVFNYNSPKNKDSFYYKEFNGETYSYRYYNSGKENVTRQIKILRKMGFKVRVEYIGDEHYIIWKRKITT